MGIEVFKRYEFKYKIDLNTYYKLLDVFNDHLNIDEFNKDNKYYTICNIYFDTQDNNLIRTSLSKPKYKEKLRLRGYGVPNITDKVYLEIKKKFNGVVNKRRSKLTLSESYDFVRTKLPPARKGYMNNQVIKEIEYVLNIYPLSPKLYLAYDRQAFFGKDDKNLRITFDFNIRSRRSELGLELGDHGTKLLDDNIVLLEIKSSNSLPLWLTQTLSKHKIYRTSFSKYGTEYKNLLKNSTNIEAPTPPSQPSPSSIIMPDTIYEDPLSILEEYYFMIN